jgi:hypothetical protein
MAKSNWEPVNSVTLGNCYKQLVGRLKNEQEGIELAIGVLEKLEFNMCSMIFKRNDCCGLAVYK